MALTQTGDEAPQNRQHAALIEAGRATQFKPGVSGNPGGRPRKIKEAEQVAVDNLVKAMTKVAEHIDNEDARVSLQASMKMIETVMGKPKQTVETKSTTDAKELDEADLVDIATASSKRTAQEEESKTQPH